MKKPKMTDHELNNFWIKEHLRKLAKPVRQAAKRSHKEDLLEVVRAIAIRRI
jgi:hypothetical protein